MIVVGDTSGVIAALNRSEPEHHAARDAWRKASTTVISSLVLAEIEHVLTRGGGGRAAAYAASDWLLEQAGGPRIQVSDVSLESLRRARRVQNHYASLRLDLADAVNVVLAERYETAVVLTLDRRDFRAIRPLTEHDAFRLLPDDL